MKDYYSIPVQFQHATVYPTDLTRYRSHGDRRTLEDLRHRVDRLEELVSILAARTGFDIDGWLRQKAIDHEDAVWDAAMRQLRKAAQS